MTALLHFALAAAASRDEQLWVRLIKGELV